MSLLCLKHSNTKHTCRLLICDLIPFALWVLLFCYKIIHTPIYRIPPGARAGHGAGAAWVGALSPRFMIPCLMFEILKLDRHPTYALNLPPECQIRYIFRDFNKREKILS